MVTAIINDLIVNPSQNYFLQKIFLIGVDTFLNSYFHNLTSNIGNEV